MRKVGQATNERSSWIDWEASEVHIFGKGGKRRIVPVGKVALQALDVWRAEWQTQMPDEFGPLLLMNRGKFWTSYGPARLKKLANLAGCRHTVVICSGILLQATSYNLPVIYALYKKC
jgi:integrase/recombinase XerC